MLDVLKCKANPYDNAAMESFHAILRGRSIQVTYINYEHAKLAFLNVLKGGTIGIVFMEALVL